MSYFKISLVSACLLFLAVVHAQDYFYEDENVESNARFQRDLGEATVQRSNVESREHLRFRRQSEENARHRRSGHGDGGHGGHGGHEGVTGPVHTFVKTDEHAHFKWGVRHHVGHGYAGHH